MRSLTARRTGALLIAGLFTVTGLAACSDNAGSDNTQSGAKVDGDGVADATSRVDELIKEPTSIGLDQKIAASIPAGKKLFFAAANNPSITIMNDHFEDIGKTLGWDVTILPYTYGDPQAAIAAIEQGIAAKSDYIVVSNEDETTVGPALDAAKKAGIPVVDISANIKADPDNNGVVGVVEGVEFSLRLEEALVDWAIVDSKGAANVLYVSLPAASVLKTIEPQVKDYISTKCPGCKITTLDLSVDDLASGGVPTAVVSALQKDPTITHVQFSAAALSGGTVDAIKASGIDAKVTVALGDEPTFTALKAGDVAAIAPVNQAYFAYSAADLLARLSAGEDPLVDEHIAQPPVNLLTQETAPDPVPTAYSMPADFADQFKKLWNK